MEKWKEYITISLAISYFYKNKNIFNLYVKIKLLVFHELKNA
jgi:hypothetical protein